MISPLQELANEYLEKNTKIAIGSMIEKRELYNKYFDYCHKQNIGFVSVPQFSQLVYKKYINQTMKDSQIGNKRVWKNIIIIP